MDPVLLGTCDEEVGEDVTDWKTNKFGGFPDFPNNVSVKTPVCKMCGKRLLLVTQLYCPLQGSSYHRTIYVFGCVTKTCWNKPESWKAIRVQQMDSNMDTASDDRGVSKETVAMATTDWCDDADDWGVSKETVAMATTDWCDDADDWGVSKETVAMATVDAITSAPLDVNTHSARNRDERKSESDILVKDLQCLQIEKQAADSTITHSPVGVSENITKVGEGTVSVKTDADLTIYANTRDTESPACIAEDVPSVDWSNALSVLATHGGCGQSVSEMTAAGQTTSGAFGAAEMSACQQSTPDLLFNKTNTHGTINDTSMVKEICFKPYYVSVFEENEVKVNNSDLESRDLGHINQLLKEYSHQEGVSVQDVLLGEEERSRSGKVRMKDTGGKVKVTGGGDQYEKVTARHGDLVFEKFKKIISLCPEQCIRYQREGNPLYITKLLGSSWTCPPCDSCGATRVYEFQLLPTLVNVLQLRHAEGSVIEFGTVLIYTCGRSCWREGDSVLVEKVLVQPDPDSTLFR